MKKLIVLFLLVWCGTTFAQGFKPTKEYWEIQRNRAEIQMKNGFEHYQRWKAEFDLAKSELEKLEAAEKKAEKKEGKEVISGE